MNNTYKQQRLFNINRLEEKYNTILESYLDNYKNYLINKSKLMSDNPKQAAKFKELILKDNKKQVKIINAIYDNIEYSDEINEVARIKNKKTQNAIKKNKNVLEKQRSLLLQDKDELLTKEEKINQLESLYRGKYKTYTGVFITDIVIGILLMLMLIFSFK